MTKAAYAWGYVVVAVSLGLLPIARGQAVPKQAARPRPQLGVLVQRLESEVGALHRDIDASAPRTAEGKLASQDVKELAQTVAEFRLILPKYTNPFQARRAYTAVNASWRVLDSQLSSLQPTTAAVARDRERVNQIDTQILEAYAMNVLPQDYYSATKAPLVLPQAKRLAHALSDRAEELLDAARGDLAGEAGARIIEDATRLAQMVDIFHDGIDLTTRLDLARNGYAGVAARSKAMAAELRTTQLTDRVRNAWRSYKQAEVLLRQTLGLPIDPRELAGTVLVTAGPSPAAPLADELDEQTGEFVRLAAEDDKRFPEGDLFLADYRRLRTAAAKFRDDAGKGLSPAQLAFAFRDVDANWQRVAQRANRLLRVLPTLTLQHLNAVEDTCARIHRLLGLPGYPADVLVPNAG